MVPPQPQQQMGVGHMGMYSGVMPYGIVPGMHQQVCVLSQYFCQASVALYC